MSEDGFSRLDQALLARGLAPSRAKAQEMVRAGRVRIGGDVATKSSARVRVDDLISVDAGDDDWVSRAGRKLAYGLDRFSISPAGLIVLDIGASTGGFTEVCLSRGASHVYAVDVGRDQLHPRLRGDARVTSLEGLDARDLDASRIPKTVDCVVADVSFIALSKALPNALALTRPGATLVALVKPQFEVGREAIGKNGLVKSAEARRQALDDVADWLVSLDWRVIGTDRSPILGGAGAEEFLICAAKPE